MELRGLLRQNSNNNSKLPSSDGYSKSWRNKIALGNIFKCGDKRYVVTTHMKEHKCLWDL